MKKKLICLLIACLLVLTSCEYFGDDFWNGILSDVAEEVSRAFIDNDREMYWKVWHNFNLENTRFYVTKITPSKDSIAFDGNLSSRTNLIGKLHIEYCMTNLGLKMTLGAKINEEIPYLPRFGLSLSLLSSFMKANYIGYGPNESYIDKHQASYFSKHSFDCLDFMLFFISTPYSP